MTFLSALFLIQTRPIFPCCSLVGNFGKEARIWPPLIELNWFRGYSQMLAASPHSCWGIEEIVPVRSRFHTEGQVKSRALAWNLLTYQSTMALTAGKTSNHLSCQSSFIQSMAWWVSEFRTTDSFPDLTREQKERFSYQHQQEQKRMSNTTTSAIIIGQDNFLIRIRSLHITTCKTLVAIPNGA